MARPIIRERHELRIDCHFSKRELDALLEAAVVEQLEDHRDLPRKVEIKFEEQTEGSPPYKTGMRATVSIVVDLNQAPSPQPVPGAYEHAPKA